MGDVVSLLDRVFSGVDANKAAAAVPRPLKTMSSMLGPHFNVGSLERAGLTGVDVGAPSVNGGLVAFNLRRWRDLDITRRVEALIPIIRKQLRTDGFSGMSTVSDTQTPLFLLLLNATPMDIEFLPGTWNVDGLGWRAVPTHKLCGCGRQPLSFCTAAQPHTDRRPNYCSTGNFLHWSGRRKPWLAKGDPLVRYTDLWQPFGRSTEQAQARFAAAAAAGVPPNASCSLRVERRRGATCSEVGTAAFDLLAYEVLDDRKAVERHINAFKKNKKTVRTKMEGQVTAFDEYRRKLDEYRRKLDDLLRENALTGERVTQNERKARLTVKILKATAGIALILGLIVLMCVFARATKA